MLLLIPCFENFTGKSGKKKKKSSAEGDSDVVNTYSRISKAISNTSLRAILFDFQSCNFRVGQHNQSLRAHRSRN